MELPDLAADAPAGPNLELDDAFGALERAAQGTPERQAGDKVIPAEEPVWRDVAEQAEALLARTYDLRVLAHLAVARLHLGGVSDFAPVLITIGDMLDGRWEHVHPQLEAEDDNDPTFRANALLQLAHPTRVLRVLRTMPLASSQRAGDVSWRVIAVSLGSIEALEGEHREDGSGDPCGFRGHAACEGRGAPRRYRNRAARDRPHHRGVRRAHRLRKCPRSLRLTKLFQEIDRYIGLYDVAGATEESGEMSPAADEGGEDQVAAPPQGVARGGALSVLKLTAVTSRAEALHLLDLACRYYEENEPSSPLPLLIARARRLAGQKLPRDLAGHRAGRSLARRNIVQSREGYYKSTWCRGRSAAQVRTTYSH